MKKLLAITPLLFISGCIEQEPKVAGQMTESSICSTAGYIIKQRLGKNVKTVDVSCTVKHIVGNTVEIDSGYISPLNPKTLTYTARATVDGNTLRMDFIKVDGIDEIFRPFHYFP